MSEPALWQLGCFADSPTSDLAESVYRAAIAQLQAERDHRFRTRSGLYALQDGDVFTELKPHVDPGTTNGQSSDSAVVPTVSTPHKGA